MFAWLKCVIFDIRNIESCMGNKIRCVQSTMFKVKQQLTFEHIDLIRMLYSGKHGMRTV